MIVSGHKQKRARPSSPPLSAYAGKCARCNMARSCDVCIATLQCGTCTEGARCGSCRNKHSTMHRAGVLRACSCRAAATGGRRSLQLLETVDHLDLPRSRAGLNQLYQLVATKTTSLRYGRPRAPSCLPVFATPCLAFRRQRLSLACQPSPIHGMPSPCRHTLRCPRHPHSSPPTARATLHGAPRPMLSCSKRAVVYGEVPRSKPTL